MDVPPPIHTWHQNYPSASLDAMHLDRSPATTQTRGHLKGLRKERLAEDTARRPRAPHDLGDGVELGTRASRLMRILGALIVLTPGCGRLDELPYEPATTGQQWCQQRPCLEIGNTVLTEPLGTVLVLLLTVLWLMVGSYFIRTRRGQKSRAWFGLALILGGVGAAQAGISYQAFSYVLKCEGWEYCRLTNGLEVGYNLTQGFSVNSMLVAVAFACTTGPARTVVISYAAVNSLIYAGVTIAGVVMPSAVLLSFVMLMLFASPGLILAIVLAGRLARTDPMSRVIVKVALLQILIQAAYFMYYASGITEHLWDRGFFFSENDVLHVGMIIWLGYVRKALGPLLTDRELLVPST